jgi:hypothetical protein
MVSVDQVRRAVLALWIDLRDILNTPIESMIELVEDGISVHLRRAVIVVPKIEVRRHSNRVSVSVEVSQVRRLLLV